jgi:hypothetical protein
LGDDCALDVASSSTLSDDERVCVTSWSSISDVRAEVSLPDVDPLLEPLTLRRVSSGNSTYAGIKPFL